MDIWDKLYLEAKAQYHPEEVTPFIYAHAVVCALEAEDGRIFTGFCIESCGDVVTLCAERVAALNMYVNSGQTVIKRLIAFVISHLMEAAAACRAVPAVSFSCNYLIRIARWRSWSIMRNERPSP